MLSSRRTRRSHDPLIVWVVDPTSPVTRRDLGAVRDTAVAVHEEIPIEVVVTGDGPAPEAAGRAIVALLASGEVHPVRVVEDVVRALHDDGADPGQTETVLRLAAQRQQDAEAVAVLSRSPIAAEAVVDDRETARSLGDPEGQALFYLGPKEVVRLPDPSAGARDIVAAIRTVHGRG